MATLLDMDVCTMCGGHLRIVPGIVTTLRCDGGCGFVDIIEEETSEDIRSR